MSEFDFSLKFKLADELAQPEQYIDLLAEAGCDDALIGIGQQGRIALQFIRQAPNAFDAVLSAIEQVKSVLPQAQLIEASPDLVGVSDIAEVMGFSRQNMRKLMMNHQHTFPAPIHDGAAAIWHLFEVLQWFERYHSKSIDSALLAISDANMQLNIVKLSVKLDPEFNARAVAIV